MTPRFMLARWRERWEKTPGTAMQVPYVEGKVKDWCNKLVHASIWSPQAIVVTCTVLCLLLTGMLCSVRFSLNSQVVVAGATICMAYLLRRYDGMLITLTLAWLSLIATARYLMWRFSDTLGSGLDPNFLLGFGLCVAELYLSVMIATGCIRRIWPLTREASALAADQSAWPTVVVLILCQRQSFDDIDRAARRALTFNWPTTKFSICLLDDAARDEIKALADSIGADCLAQVNQDDGNASAVNHALAHTTGELIVVLDCDYCPDPGFLKSIAGWFDQDPTLGMLQTPHHFLTPAPSQAAVEVFERTAAPGTCAILRRSMLAEAGGIESEIVAWQPHTALKLSALGYGCAYFGVANPQHQDRTDHLRDEPTRDVTPPALVRLDQPFSAHILWMKQRLATLEEVMRFYYVVPRLIFFTAPLAYLFFGAKLIDASPQLLAAYGLAHVVHAHIARARLHGDYRFSLLMDLRETLLAYYLLVPTALNLIRTEFAKIKRRFHKPPAAPVESFDWLVALPFSLLALLHLAGLAVGVGRLLMAESGESEIASFYLAWCIADLMLLASMLALAEEGRSIRHYHRQKAIMPAMLRLPFGRTLSCMTDNFPDNDLTLTLPAPVTIEPGTMINLSIFEGHHEFVFPAQVVVQQDKILKIHIDDRPPSNYRDFAAAALSRGSDWPKWLAGQQADRLIPAWIKQRVINLAIAGLDFVQHASRHLHWLSPINWIHLWKKKK